MSGRTARSAAATGRRGALDRSRPEPLWAQLLADLRARAESGEFTARFPGELELVEDYGVSRHTVREALRRLRTEGLVVARRGHASYLAASRFEQPLGTAYSLFRTIEAQGVEQRSEVLRLDLVQDAEVADRLELPPRTELVVLERRRLADDEPLALDTSWLPAEVARPLLGVDFGRTALYDELARRCGVVVDGGQERIVPVVPDPAQARALGIAAGTAAFSLSRLATSQGRPVEWRRTLVRGDRYCFVASWSATAAYHLGLVPAPPEAR
jgi:GntR family transcriptional regulator